MPDFGFLPIAHIEHLLRDQPAQIRDIVLELRNLVAEACPGASESILWGGLSYHDAGKGGRVKGAICMIEFKRRPPVQVDAVRLSFIHGVRLSDPGGLLQGDRLSKRFVEIDSYEEAPWDAIRALIEEAAGLDPERFEPIKSSKP